MTEIKLPQIKELKYPTLEVIRDHGGSATRSEILEAVPQVFELTEEQLSIKHSAESGGESKVHHRIGWALTELKNIGAAENSKRGVWSITQKGNEYLSIPRSEAEKKMKEDMGTYEKFSKPKNKMLGEDIENDEDIWKENLLSALKKMSPDAFERLAQRILREAGFDNVEVTGRPGDGGIDGVGIYKVSLVSFPTYFQCKRANGSVSASTVRDFRGSMVGRGDKGLLITTGTFTSGAIAEANRDGAPPVNLISGNELCDLLVEYRIGVRVEERIVLDVEVNNDFFMNL